MDRRTGDRGVSEVVGFILLFGMLVIAFTVYQGIVVPDQNRQVEFQHNQEVQGQLQDLRNAILTTAATGSGQAVSVTLGASYPNRAIARNLGVSAGSIGTTSLDGGGISIENVSTTDAETGDYVEDALGPFETEATTYTPVYTFYTNAPETVYENSILYNRFGDANVTLAGQSVVDGRQITLITVNGSLSIARRDTVSVNTRPISVSTNEVPITANDSSRRITITIPTRLSAGQWRNLLGEEYDPADSDPDAYVVDVADAGPNRVSFVLERGVTYDLRMARIGLGQATDSTSAHYLTIVSGNGSSVAAGDTEELVVEVRDRYNNPVSGVTVNVTDDGAGDVPSSAKVTDATGRARFAYTAPPATGTDSVTMNISTSPAAREEVLFELNVQGSGVGGGAGGSGVYDVRWKDPSGEEGTQPADCDARDCTWDIGDDSDASLSLTAETAPELDGMTLGFAVDNNTVARIDSADGETDSNGEATVDLEALANGTVGVFVGSGGSSDRINITVVGRHRGLVYNDDASASSGSGVAAAVVEFSVANQRSGDVTVHAITVEESTSGDQISEGEPGQTHEVMIDTDGDGSPDGEAEAGGFFDQRGFDVGDRIDLDTTATIPSGGSADVTLYEFRDDGGDPVDMSGEEITVTFHYEDADGNSFARTFTIPIP